MRQTLVVTRADVAALLPLGECIAVVEDAFRSLGLGLAEPPATLAVRSGTGTFHVKAGILPRATRRYFAVKYNGNFPENPVQLGLPTIQGLLLLSDAETGSVLAVMDSSEITALRTGAATAVAARLLARSGSEVAAICGCGVQGRVQLRALAEVLPLTRAYAYDANFEKARTYAEEMTGVLHIPVIAERELAGMIARADVCVTCTPATAFILHRDMVRAGTFVAGVGADSESKRELAPDLLAGASRVVTDLREQCAVIGDLHHAIAANVMAESAVHADLAEVVAGTRCGRETDDEVIVFDSTGLALQDAAAAAAVYERAVSAGRDGGVFRVAFA